MRQTSIRKIMSDSVVTVGANDSLETIRQIFSHAKFHHLLVVEDDALVGVISDRDLLKVLSPNLDTPAETLEDMATLEKRASEIMSTELVVLDGNATVGDAVDVFNQHLISCIPVVGAANKVLGIVSWRDILRSIPA
jgi:acetoin utilization protein AcuB